MQPAESAEVIVSESVEVSEPVELQESEVINIEPREQEAA